MKNLFYCFILLFMASIFSCQAPAADCSVDTDAIKSEIQALEDAFAAAAAAKDADAQVAYYADDAISMPANEPMIMGKEAILARTKAKMEEESDDEGTVKYEVKDIFAAGDYATEIGTWAYSDSSGAVLSSGKYIAVFEKRDGKYVCIRDIWNSDAAEGDDDDDDDDDDEQGS